LVAALPGARVGEGVRVQASGRSTVTGRVAAVERARVLVTPFQSLAGVAVGDRLEIAPEALQCVLGYGALGRAIDGSGAPLDGRRALRGTRHRIAAGPLELAQRLPVAVQFWTGVRAIDGLLAFGCGARVGIFGSPGSGKTMLLEAIVSGSRADVVVVALIGERGREAQNWLERVDRRTTLVCATADRTAAERVRAAEAAMAQAVVLSERGLEVLLVVDSLARYVAALREQRSALGEPVGRGGYPPSVWADFSSFVERAGNSVRGSITLVATVLADADEDRDPVCAAARASLDGHIMLSSSLARAARYPAIDILASTSRTMQLIAGSSQRDDAETVRRGMAHLAATEELRAAGLANVDEPRLAKLLAAEPALEAFLHRREMSPPEATRALLRALAASFDSV
jgi:type III secretion protein N (ATPase)